MEVTISTPERLAFSGAADSVVVHADKGQLTILPQHANLITFVEEGPLKVTSGGAQTDFEVSGGVLKVENEKISVLCQRVVRNDN